MDNNKRLTVQQAMTMLDVKTFTALAERLGTTRQAVNHWRHGKYKRIPKWWSHIIRGMVK